MRIRPSALRGEGASTRRAFMEPKGTRATSLCTAVSFGQSSAHFAICYTPTMKTYTQLKIQLLKDKEIKRAYDALEPEFALVETLIQKRLLFRHTLTALTYREIQQYTLN